MKRIKINDETQNNPHPSRWYILEGASGALVFGVYLPREGFPNDEIFSSGIDYHARKPRHEWEKPDEPSQASCCWLGGDPCWQDGSSMAGADLLRNSRNAEREDIIWRVLSEWYEDKFGVSVEDDVKDTMPEPMTDENLTIPQAAKLLNLSTWQILRDLRESLPLSVDAQGRTTISRKDIDAYRAGLDARACERGLDAMGMERVETPDADRLAELSARYYTHPDDGGDFLSSDEINELCGLQHEENARLTRERDEAQAACAEASLLVVDLFVNGPDDPQILSLPAGWPICLADELQQAVIEEIENTPLPDQVMFAYYQVCEQKALDTEGGSHPYWEFSLDHCDLEADLAEKRDSRHKPNPGQAFLNRLKKAETERAEMAERLPRLVRDAWQHGFDAENADDIAGCDAIAAAHVEADGAQPQARPGEENSDG